ncbi:C25 family cysteine peptidase [Methanosarcina sp. Mfa9]|uniref:C25 family cysteine peptidase n=1 Tax=Methanosarcina sp. Mfa9 TaxID=3439063 RepID=UPI003F82CC91
MGVGKIKEFKSLSPEGLPESFDAAIHGEEPIVQVEESKGRISISYTFPGFYLSDNSLDVDGERINFKGIKIPKAGFLSESGKPLLPSFGRYVQIPFNFNFEFTVKKGKTVQFDDLLLLPAQEELTDNPEEEHAFEYDEKFYSSDEFYPENIVEVTGPFDVDGYNSLLVHVRPFQYNPAKKKLVGYANIVVEITVTPATKESDEYPLIDRELSRESFGNFFLNPGRRVDERLEIEKPTVVNRCIQPGPEFLIIYHDIFREAAEKLAKWKNMRGIRTETISITAVGNTVSNIKKYIRNKRKACSSRLRYVLLFGDVDMIASETISGGPFGANITDYYYSTPKDPVGSNDIVMPWLSTGRIPMRKPEEGADVVEQIIRFEKDPPCDPEYYRRMAFGAYFQDDKPLDGRADKKYMKTMEAIREHMISLGFDVERVYVSSNPNPQEYIDGTPVPAEVKNSIVDGYTATDMLISATTEGQLIMGHRDHGLPKGWDEPSFTKRNLDTILSEYPTIFYSINCVTGQFDLTGPTECFAEKILKMKGGSPSLIAATRDSGTWRNDSLIKALFDAMWAGLLPTFPGSTSSYPVKYNRLGDIMNYAKSYLPIAHTGENAGIKDHFEIYHVIGDPTIELWSAEPLPAGLKAKIMMNNLYISLSSCPKGGVVTVWYEDKVIKRIEPSSKYIKIPLKEIVLRPISGRRNIISVCFHAPGHRFRQVHVRF